MRPVLLSAILAENPTLRRLLMQAARRGYFYGIVSGAFLGFVIGEVVR